MRSLRLLPRASPGLYHDTRALAHYRKHSFRQMQTGLLQTVPNKVAISLAPQATVAHLSAVVSEITLRINAVNSHVREAPGALSRGTTTSLRLPSETSERRGSILTRWIDVTCGASQDSARDSCYSARSEAEPMQRSSDASRNSAKILWRDAVKKSLAAKRLSIDISSLGEPDFDRRERFVARCASPTPVRRCPCGSCPFHPHTLTRHVLRVSWCDSLKQAVAVATLVQLSAASPATAAPGAADSAAGPGAPKATVVPTRLVAASGCEDQPDHAMATASASQAALDVLTPGATEPADVHADVELGCTGSSDDD